MLYLSGKRIQLEGPKRKGMRGELLRRCWSTVSLTCWGTGALWLASMVVLSLEFYWDI